MMMHKALNPRNYIDRLYVSRKEGDRILDNIENSINTSIRLLKDLVKKKQRKLNYNDQKQHTQRKDPQNNNN